MTEAPRAAESSLVVGGAARRLRVGATWTTPPPPRAPRATVWLQHGFARSRRTMTDLADHLADSGFAVLTTSLRTADFHARTVQYLRDNRPFLTDLAAALDGPELRASWKRAGLPGDPPAVLLATGHSAGADAAAHVAAETLTGTRRIGGLVLLDPVRSARGDNLGVGVMRLTAARVPIRIVAAPPSRCNAHGSGLRRVLPLLEGFAGILLTGGSHADAEGRSAGRLAQWMCGAVSPDNVSALETVTAAWLGAMARQEQPIAPGPHDPPIERLVAEDRARLLWGAR